MAAFDEGDRVVWLNLSLRLEKLAHTPSLGMRPLESGLCGTNPPNNKLGRRTAKRLALAACKVAHA